MSTICSAELSIKKFYNLWPGHPVLNVRVFFNLHSSILIRAFVVIINTVLGTITPTVQSDDKAVGKPPGPPVAPKPQLGQRPFPPSTASESSFARNRSEDDIPAKKKFDVAKLSIKVRLVYIIYMSLDARKHTFEISTRTVTIRPTQLLYSYRLGLWAIKLEK